MKAMKGLGKERPELTIELVKTTFEKGMGGDWDHEVLAQTFKRVRQVKEKHLAPRAYSEDYGSENPGFVRAAMQIADRRTSW
jgi:hypothetical protein